jgi:S-adenosylmethionine:tRNA ribosyltransferase-isomerase
VTLDDFDFHLPPEQIAQAPLPERDRSRLLRLSRATGRTTHHRFDDLPSLLRPGDLLVVNDARVIPARLLGSKVPTGGRAELLVVRPAAHTSAPRALAEAPEATEWICLGQASKGLKAGAQLAFDGGLSAQVTQALGGGEVRVRFAGPEGSFSQALERAGRLPLPPYISREPSAADAERYQTVFARSLGSAAAPTAGLHFTQALFEALEARGIHRAALTLDVGPGTFLPVREENLDAHKMHEERYQVPEETAARIEATKADGGRVVAVGTTVVRTRAAATDPATGRLRTGAGETALFIRPGYAFRQIDALITNFHLPRSTLLMLVSAFAGREHTLAAYREAVAEGYRFFSYGDAMLIEDRA